MDLELKGKRAIVTGGSRGIGKAIARSLLGEGVQVALVARGREALEATAAELARDTGGKVIAVPTDTGDDASVRAMAETVRATLGGVDILVNNAAEAGGQGQRVPKTEDLGWDDLFPHLNVKVMGYARCAKAVVPGMKAAGWGRIINISGLAARTTGSIVGSVRNVAVAAMTKNMADELGPHGINVTVVHPGLTRTEATAGVIAARAAATNTSAAEVERTMADGNSVRRIIDADDIAWIVTMLASPRSIAINGDAIAAGGGMPRNIHY
jgi:NAD(P)-dependent dehydrogenase (short-subunit alcohol dehydrogenase family)